MPEENKPHQYCCEVFPKIMGELKWMRVSVEGKNYMCMPHIEAQLSSELYRVNYCPSCGKAIRSTLIEVSEFLNKCPQKYPKMP